MKFRDEQKGILFLSIIFLIAIGVGIYIYLSLRTDNIGDSLKNDQVIRTLYVIADNDNNAIATEILVYYPVSKKSVLVNIPYNIGGIYRVLKGADGSQGRTDGISSIYKENGVLAYKSQIEELLDTTIPFFVVVKLEDYIKVTDMLGGFRVFIPEPVDALSDDGNRWLLPSGAVTLDGDKVATYISYKMPNETDTESYERFQNIFVAFFTQLSENKSIILSKQNVNKFISFMSTNLERKDFITYLNMIADINTEYILKQNVTGSFRMVGGKRLLFPLNGGDFIKQALAQATNMLISTGDTQTSRIYVLEIQNGTTVQGLAHNTGILFKNASYDILRTTNADRNDYEKTVIIDHIGSKDIAEMVGSFINCTNIESEKVNLALPNNEVANVDFTIILGKDFDGRYVR